MNPTPMSPTLHMFPNNITIIKQIKIILLAEVLQAGINTPGLFAVDFFEISERVFSNS